MPQNTVTVTGSDRTKLLADLTVRLGRVEVVEEHQVQLGDGSEGWQLTVSHRRSSRRRADARAGGGACRA